MTLTRDPAPLGEAAANRVRTAADGSRIARLLADQRRQGADFIADLIRMRGLMPLLMKRRNGALWTAAEKAELLMQLRILSRLSPYLLLLLLPGSTLLLPGYAWWIDRRRHTRHKPEPDPGKALPNPLPDA